MIDYKLNLKMPWEQVKEKLKEIVVELTDEDLAYSIGEEKELLEKLAKKLDRDMEFVKDWIESVSFNEGKAS